MKVKLSVIIPMYNVESYIIKCLNSVLAQSVEAMEVIVIDDGSTDLSYSKALEIQKDNPSIIKLFKQNNKGQSSARNFGLQKSKGEYIAFCDSDDFIKKDMYNKMLSKAQMYNLDIVQCNYLNWYGENSKKNFDYPFQAIEDHVYSGTEYFELEPSLSPCDKIFNRSFLRSIGFWFEEGRYAEDALEISKTYYHAKKIIYINEVFYYYRRESINSTRNSVDLKKSTKLGVDKIYIAYKLNEFTVANKWEGVIRKVIFRNIIGPFMKKEIKIKSYRESVIGEFTKRNCLSILLRCLKIADVKSYIGIGINKFLLNKRN